MFGTKNEGWVVQAAREETDPSRVLVQFHNEQCSIITGPPEANLNEDESALHHTRRRLYVRCTGHESERCDRVEREGGSCRRFGAPPVDSPGHGHISDPMFNAHQCHIQYEYGPSQWWRNDVNNNLESGCDRSYRVVCSKALETTNKQVPYSGYPTYLNICSDTPYSTHLDVPFHTTDHVQGPPLVDSHPIQHHHVHAHGRSWDWLFMGEDGFGRRWSPYY